MIEEKDDLYRPSHYQGKNGMEAIDIIDSFDLDFDLGNCIKYILRAGKKGSKVVDLRKAVCYLQHAIRKEGKKCDHATKND